MSDSIEKIGKTTDEAIEAALRALDATRDEVDIEVLDPGAKGGIFGIGSRPAKVLVTKRLDPEQKVKAFLREATLAMGLEVTIESKLKDASIYIDMRGANMGILIGKRGATIDALQYITNLIINRGDVPRYSVVLDTENYRKRRREVLEGLARNLARRAKTLKKPVSLEPMSRYERHIIHTTLQNDRAVRTLSEGNEPHRHVVITAK